MTGKGVVLSLDGNRAKIRVTIDTECMECPSKSHCHGGGLREREIVVINDYGARVSDTVVFDADTGNMILSAALIWILPLISMIVGYIVADRFAEGAWPIIAAFAFLAASFLVLKLVDTAVTGGRAFYPRVSRVLGDSEAEKDFCRETH